MEEFRKNLTLSIIVIASCHLERLGVGHVFVALHVACLLLLSPHKPLMLHYTRVRDYAVLPKTFEESFDQLVTKRNLGVHHELREWRLHYYLDPDFKRIRVFNRVGLLHLSYDVLKFLAWLVGIRLCLLHSLMKLVKPFLNQDFALWVHDTWGKRERRHCWWIDAAVDVRRHPAQDRRTWWNQRQSVSILRIEQIQICFFQLWNAICSWFEGLRLLKLLWKLLHIKKSV